VSHSKFTPRDNAAFPPPGPPKSPDGGGVIPIRGVTPSTPTVAVRRLDRKLPQRSKSGPLERRPWRILLIPPAPGEATRALSIARWQRLLIIGLLIGLVVVATGAVTTLIFGVSSPDLFAPSADLAAIRGRLDAVEDSLTQARKALALAEDISLGPSATRNLSPDARRQMLSDIGMSSMAGLSGEGLPVNGIISSDFSTSRRHPLLHIVRPHLGLDITAPAGSRISAPAGGRVSFVGWKISLGLLIEIEHANGITTRYGHCRTAMVKAGDRVTRGTMIATVGSSGLTTGPHLHYEVWDHGNAVDPLRFRFPQPTASATVPVAGAVAAPQQD
jgi:murein DD-endopeptidase MepM/ murein hydrolase activator NlpD